MRCSEGSDIVFVWGVGAGRAGSNLPAKVIAPHGRGCTMYHKDRQKQ